MQNGDGASCGLDLRSRKRLLTPVDSENSKRVRRAGGKIGVSDRKYDRGKIKFNADNVCLCGALDVFFQMEYTGVEEPENMGTEMGLELHQGGTETCTLNYKCSIGSS